METARGEMHWVSQAHLLGAGGCGSLERSGAVRREELWDSFYSSCYCAALFNLAATCVA